MATQLAPPCQPAARKRRGFTRGSSSNLTKAEARVPSRYSHLRASASRPWVELAGRPVALSGEIPAIFDEPLAAHHRLIGRWVASRETAAQAYTRPQARQRIERVFNTAVLEILGPIELAIFRVVVLGGDEGNPPAIAVICDSMGQLDLGWIETSDAPIPWRAAAYKALDEYLGTALPIFGYQDLFDEYSMYYWEGATDDEAARQCLIDYQGADLDNLEDYALPSTMNARRPEWMIAANAAPSTELPSGLCEALGKLKNTYKALRNLRLGGNAWHFETDAIYEYIPYFEECSTLPPLTLVPVEQFAREVDDVGRHGMEYGFMDIAGLCPLRDPKRIEDWFASLRLGAQFLLAAQNLIQLDPIKL